MADMTKHCHGCGRDLDHSAFDRARTTRDGLATRCRGCRRAYHHACNHGTNPHQSATRPNRRASATRVDYVDPETLKERQSASLRLCRQKRHYGRLDPPNPADLAAHCDRADAALRAEIRARLAAGRSLMFADAGQWQRLWDAFMPAPVAAD